MKKNGTLTALDFPLFREPKGQDWSAINKKLWTNARLNNASTLAYLGELVARLAQTALAVDALGPRIWWYLYHGVSLKGEYDKLRMVLRLSEVSQAIAFHPKSAAKRAEAELMAARQQADGITNSPEFVAMAEFALGDQTAIPDPDAWIDSKKH